MGSKRFNNLLGVREFILRGGNDLTSVPHRPETMSRKPLAVAGFVMVVDLHGFQRTIGHLESAYLDFQHRINPRSEEHTAELQSLMRISYAVFCLKTKQKVKPDH